VTTAFTAASVTRTTVSSAMTWLTRSLTGSLSPANQSKRPADTSPAWCAASTATIPVTVIAVLAAASTARRGRRAISRTPISGSGGVQEPGVLQFDASVASQDDAEHDRAGVGGDPCGDLMLGPGGAGWDHGDVVARVG
jgi:hypothetical protein